MNQHLGPFHTLAGAAVIHNGYNRSTPRPGVLVCIVAKHINTRILGCVTTVHKPEWALKCMLTPTVKSLRRGQRHHTPHLIQSKNDLHSFRKSKSIPQMVPVPIGQPPVFRPAAQYRPRNNVEMTGVAAFTSWFSRGIGQLWHMHSWING